MADGQELAWDYTVDNLDNTDLVRHGDSVFYRINSDGECHLTRVQVENLVTNLKDTASILHTYLANTAPSPTPRRVQAQTSRNCLRHNICCRCLRWLKHKAEEYIFVFTLVLQFLNILLLSLLDLWPNKTDDKLFVILSTSVMIFLQIINLIALLTTSGRLLKAVVGGKKKLRLIQNYLATILVFAGLYTVTYRLSKKSWTFILPNVILDPALIVELYLRMVYLSVATATLCGSSNITPKAWYNYMLVGMQMLISFIYFSQILAQAADHYKHSSQPTDPRPELSRRDSVTSKSSVFNTTVNTTVDIEGEEMLSPLIRRHSQ